MALDMRYPTPLPSTKGWGLGWPACQRDIIRPHPIFQGGVHKDILELVNLLVAHLESKGYKFKPGWSWGFGCRATKGGSGETPSFHSWGLALDFNAPENPFNSAAGGWAKLNNEDHWVVPIMAEFGFFWLGPSIGDWMHFSFAGSPADARALTEKARRELGGADEMAYADFKQGWKAFTRGEAEPTVEGDFRFGYKAAQFAATRPLPEAHEHKGYAKKDHEHAAVPPAPHTHQVSGEAV